MAKPSAARRKTLSTANLAALGADRLAQLLLEATLGDANLKRRLKLELSAEVGPADLAFEIDKRLSVLADSKTRVSWRKRPELIADLRVHLQAIAGPLASADAGLALRSLVAWFDLRPGLEARVKDPKGELSLVFFEAADDLSVVASAVGADNATPILAEAVETRLSEWAGWVGRAAPSMNVELAASLLKALTHGRARPTGRRALVVRKLADRAGDGRAWANTWPDEEQAKPDVGAEIALRLAMTALASEAREALERCRPRAGVTRKGRQPEAPEASSVWESAEIAVLEAEGRQEEAQTARWAAFSRTLDATHLRAFTSRLADFDDVDAIDRAHALAALWEDASRGLAFLMDWPALPEAAALIRQRADELRALSDTVPLWVSRLEARFPAAALILVRSRARSLAPLGPTRADEVRGLSNEAADLAIRAGPVEGLESHAAFIDDLEALAAPVARRRWL